MKKKIPKKRRHKSKIPIEAFELKENTNYFKMTPAFRFSNTDPNKWTLSEWNSKELKDLIKTFKQMEQISWNEIFKHSGLRPKKITNYL